MNEACSQKPQMIIVCEVDPSFKTTYKLEQALRQVLTMSVQTFGFHRAALILTREGKSPVWWQAAEQSEKPDHQWEVLRKKLDEYLSQKTAEKKHKWLDLLKPVASTTLPVVLQAGKPIGTLEIGVFNTNEDTAQYMLIKAISLSRHMADIIQESFFSMQKDQNLRKVAVWLEMVSTINSTLDIWQVLHVVSQLTADLFSAKTCIYLLDENQNLNPAVAVGSFDLHLKKKLKALKGHPPFPAITQAIRTQRPVVITPRNIHRLIPDNIIKDFDYHWLVMAPITYNNNTVSIMQVDRPYGSEGFNQEEVDTFFAIARVTAIAMEKANLVEELEQKEQVLHQLVDKIITAQEEERKRLASELHDGIIQSLIAIWYHLQRIISHDENRSSWHSEIGKIANKLGEQIQETRRMLYDLRPMILDNYGLIPAIKTYANDIQEKYNLAVELLIEPGLEHNNSFLSSRYEITLFRIFQEALTNIIKHAGASQVNIHLSMQQEEILLTIKDNGTGFDKTQLYQPQSPSHLGLVSIQERALLLGGTCNIDSLPNQGTCISVKIPYKGG